MNIALAVLAWNTAPVTRKAIDALQGEKTSLEREGATVHLIGCDNGSADGSADEIRRCSRPILNTANEGSSYARNQIIEAALALNARYLMLLDGDIVAIPGSALALLTRLQWRRDAYCAGLYPFDNVRMEADASPDSRHWKRWRGVLDEAHVAFTQYGMFAMEPFAAGVRLHDAGPYRGPGWGLEDNWLHLDISERFGLRSLCLLGPRFYHALHSSWGNIGQDALRANWRERKRDFLDRWAGSDDPQAREMCQWTRAYRWADQGGEDE